MSTKDCSSLPIHSQVGGKLTFSRNSNRGRQITKIQGFSYFSKDSRFLLKYTSDKVHGQHKSGRLPFKMRVLTALSWIHLNLFWKCKS